jgi:hypothetical protein
MIQGDPNRISRGPSDKRFCSDVRRTRFGRERKVGHAVPNTAKAMALARDAMRAKAIAFCGDGLCRRLSSKLNVEPSQEYRMPQPSSDWRLPEVVRFHASL